MVYEADAGALGPYPVAVAIALIVSFADTEIGPVYRVDALVGRLPSVV
jgi:hypothetical protein